jgi:hypothetical protein
VRLIHPYPCPLCVPTCDIMGGGLIRSGEGLPTIASSRRARLPKGLGSPVGRQIAREGKDETQTAPQHPDVSYSAQEPREDSPLPPTCKTGADKCLVHRSSEGFQCGSSLISSDSRQGGKG